MLQCGGMESRAHWTLLVEQAGPDTVVLSTNNMLLCHYEDDFSKDAACYRAMVSVGFWTETPTWIYIYIY